MSNSIITRNFAGLDAIFPVRIVELDGQPWFVASDVCKVIGYCTKSDGSVNVWLALQPLSEDEITTCRISGNRGQASKLISESGLYKLVMRSDKPQARAFQDWVTRDVLPAIRKDGAYIMGEEKVASGEMDEDEFVLKAMTILTKKVERLKEENKQLTVENKAMSDELNYLTVDEYRALNTSATLTMSSREIAELTGKMHKHVLADTRKMLDELGLMWADFSADMQVPMPRGGFRTEEVFNLPKDLTITLVSGYNVQMRYAITKRWMELEAQQALSDNTVLRKKPSLHA